MTAAPEMLRVLLVEDDALIRMDTAEILRDEGLTVEEAGSGEAAVRHLSSGAFDVLVSDFHLPGMSGEVLAEQARALYPAIRVVFATGDSTAVSEAGARVLSKPYGVSELIAAVRG